MPTITLRRLRAELASRLEHLDASAALIEQHARRLSPNTLSPSSPPLLQKASRAGRRLLRGTNLTLHRSTAYIDRVTRDPRIATAVRVTHGGLHEAAFYLSIACGLLLALALALAVVAPPY